MIQAKWTLSVFGKIANDCEKRANERGKTNERIGNCNRYKLPIGNMPKIFIENTVFELTFHRFTV